MVYVSVYLQQKKNYKMDSNVDNVQKIGKKTKYFLCIEKRTTLYITNIISKL